MKSSRIKISLPTIETRDEAEALVNEIAMLTINRLRASNKMDAELTRIREGYQPALTQFDERLKQATETLRAWAEANPDQFPKGRKSIQFVSGTVGFRTGTPKLSLLSRLWNWDKVHKAIIGLGLSGYIRTKEEVDKENIIATAVANHDQAAAAAHCASFGVKVIQEESFYIDPNLTEVETRQTTEAA